MTAGVESWTRCHTVASALLAERGIAESSGWTVALDNDLRNGFDYVFDAISEVEMPPGYPGKQPSQPPQSPTSPVSKVYIPNHIISILEIKYLINFFHNVINYSVL